jgi:hypothetical protein
MERMDRVRRWGGLIWVGAGLVVMLAWIATTPASPPGLVTWIVVGTVAAGTLAMLVAPGHRLRGWGGRVAGMAIGLELVGAVGDRFGLLGGPGSPGVSWGDWSHFRAETAELVPWDALVQPAAVAATISELTLGLLLLIGAWWRWTGKATAGLFVVYLIAMVPGMGTASVLEYGVPVLIGGALVASARGARTAGTPRAVTTTRTATKEPTYR